jgi:hypothetical protein
MTDRDAYFEAKRLLDEIGAELASGSLSPEQEQELRQHAAALAGVLLHPWFPVAWRGRLIAAGIVCLGIWQALFGNYEPLIFWLALPLFSPRIVGECSFMFGRFRALLAHSSN